MTQADFDRLMMARALQLAANGRGYTSPNPMVGAVVTDSTGRIIGEGWHRRFGGPHAEVNAIASVAGSDRHLLGQATVYVTLEPCSHYGKTPPCAKLLVDTGVRRVVIACTDPNPKVSGRGVAMLRQAGIEVDAGVLEEESIALNHKFITAHRRAFPWVTLKWAQSADGYIDGHFSTPATAQIVHKRRSEADAIIVGAATVLADKPKLNVRLIEGRSPRPVVLDRRNTLANSIIPLMQNHDTLHITDGRSVRQLLEDLYRDFGYISVLVEGGASVMHDFIQSGLWDEAYVERSPEVLGGSVKAPVLHGLPMSAQSIGDNIIFNYKNTYLT